LKNGVKLSLRFLRNKTILDLGITGITFAILGAALIWSNLNGIITAVGLGGTSLYAQAKSWENTVVAYWKDKTNLNMIVYKIKSKYDECTPNNETCLKEVQGLIDKFIEQLISASQSGK
jgi:hypothetical protein